MSTYRTPGVGAGRPRTVDSGFYCDIRFDGDSYIGLHVTNGASTADLNWKIYKLTDTRIQVAYGSWDGRAGLF